MTISGSGLASFPDGGVTLTVTKGDGHGNLTQKTATGVLDSGIAPPTVKYDVDAITSQNHTAVPVSGTAEPGATINLTVNPGGSSIQLDGAATADADGNGNTTVDVSELGDGTITTRAEAEDAAGNTAATGAGTDALLQKDATGPTLTASGGDSTTVTFTSNQVLDPASVNTDTNLSTNPDFTLTLNQGRDVSVLSITVSGDAMTITVTLSEALDIGESLSLTVGAVTDTAGTATVGSNPNAGAATHNGVGLPVGPPG